ncbi:MAG TPA: metalloprotease TldD [Burkholderiaceae bacterium]|nr:metalloprotease TldD [Burkholderiaceae bacterium]
MDMHDPQLDRIAAARAVLLEPFGLDESALTKVLGEIFTHRVDYADLYFQHTRFENWVLEEGIVKSGSYNVDQGVGVRSVAGDRTAFAYSDDISLSAIRSAAEATRTIARAGANQRVKVTSPFTHTASRDLYQGFDPLATLSSDKKVALLERIERMALAMDPRVVRVVAQLVGEHDVILLARCDRAQGPVIAADVRPLVRVSISVFVEHNGQRESGHSGGGGRFGYGYFDDAVLERYAREAVDQALLSLEAKPAPAGVMPVVLGAGWPGILLHEAIGHGLEGDFNRKGSSAFSGRVGERVAAPGVTVVDDGTLPDRRGSLNVDDEGNPTQRTVLIEDGILKGYLQDAMNARLMKTAVTGNARRESFAHLPMPRMTNTYMLAGSHDPQEIVASLEDGLYAVNFDGGQVDITNGKFVFTTSEAYRVKNGKILYPVKGATLIGNGPDALTRVSMIGNDLALDHGVGVCGKEGQSLPVGVGQPTLRIEGLTVGGTG